MLQHPSRISHLASRIYFYTVLLDDDPKPLDGKYLGEITSDFVGIAELLKEAAYQVKVRHISDYPIFPICRTAQPIGSLLLAAGQKDLRWNYYFSFAEEFNQRGLLSDEGFEILKLNYKPLDEFCCLFVIDEEFTKFLNIPYPDDLNEDRIF